MTDAAWGTLSNQAVTAAGVVYFLALLAHVVEWSALRQVDRSRVLVGATGPAETSGEPDSERHRDRVAVFGRLGLLLTGAAVSVHLVALVGRGMSAEPNRVPWGNMYEFTLSGTFVVALLYLVLGRRHSLEWMAPLVLGFVLTLLMVAVLWLYDPTGPLPEALNSPWLVIHVVSAILATGAFTLGGMISAVYLLKQRRGADAPATGLWSRVPSPGAARPDLLPDPRLRLPRVDLRGADHRADLGAPGVVVVLELGPQGGLGVHHLGRLRRLPARAHDRGLAGPQRGDPGPGRHRHLVVQLHRDQLLLDLEPALLRRRRPRLHLARAGVVTDLWQALTACRPAKRP